MKRTTPTKTRSRKGKDGNPNWDARQLDALIEEAIVDAYGESEQKTGFQVMLDDNLALPFQTVVLGVEVTVERIDLTSAEEIVALCRRGKTRQTIPILDLPLPTPPPKGAEWIAAYRRWARGSRGETAG